MESNVFTEVIGYTAAFLTTFALLPQVLKTIKTKSAHDISMLWIGSLTIGIAFWLLYGILLASFPIILANGLSLLFAGIQLGYKIKYG